MRTSCCRLIVLILSDLLITGHVGYLSDRTLARIARSEQPTTDFNVYCKYLCPSADTCRQAASFFLTAPANCLASDVIADYSFVDFVSRDPQLQKRLQDELDAAFPSVECDEHWVADFATADKSDTGQHPHQNHHARCPYLQGENRHETGRAAAEPVNSV